IMIDLAANRNINQLLCQGWEMEDDMEPISQTDEGSGMLPFRSFYFSPDSTFVKNPRNAIEFGKWIYSDEKKTITLDYTNGGRDIYKIAAIAADELQVINCGIKSFTILK